MRGRGGMADAPVLGAGIFDVRVQVPSPAPLKGYKKDIATEKL